MYAKKQNTEATAHRSGAMEQIPFKRASLKSLMSRNNILKTVVLLCFVACALGSLNAQTKQLKREVLFTLGQNEEIYYGEYFVAQQLHKNRFACVVYDTAKKTYAFVFNEKKMEMSEPFFHAISYLDVNEDNGYVFTFEKKDGGYINYKGKVDGPFDEMDFLYLNANEPNGYVFTFKKKDGRYINYKGKVDGPFDEVYTPQYYYDDFRHYYDVNVNVYDYCYYYYDISCSLESKVRGADYLYALGGRWYAHKDEKDKRVYKEVEYVSENGKKCVIIKGEKSPAYDEVYYLQLTESGKYAYSYKENGKYYVYIKGEEKSPAYDEVYYLQLTASGKYAYRYKENGKYYVYIKGEGKSPAYDAVGYLQLTESGKYAYCYNENGKWYVNITGEKSSAYDYVSDLQLTESGKYAYSYNENGKHYVNIIGEKSPAYDEVDYLRLTESGKYAYCYKENGKWYAYIKGEAKSPAYDYVDELQLTESGKYAYIYKENDKYYVYIKGEKKPTLGYYFGGFYLTETNECTYYFTKDDGWVYKNKNGKETKTEFLQSNGDLEKFATYRYYSANADLEIFSTNREHSFATSYKYEYVIIDGRRYGKSPALHCWYDKEKNAFVWNAIEGKELVVYECKLD